MPTLADILSQLLLRMWPARAHQELLLDLGEHKGWGEAGRLAVVETMVGWMQRELLMPAELYVIAGTAITHELPDVPLDNLVPQPGVARKTVALAGLAGVAAKTLANSLTRGLQCDRGDHRWLCLLARVQRRELNLSDSFFHERSPTNVAERLARAFASPNVDAADAALMLSLVALWQRRRLPSEARGSRGKSMPRRLVPKPAVSMSGELMVLSQLGPLLDLAVHWRTSGGALLAAFVVDVALTEAHFAAHRPRRTGSPSQSTTWLETVGRALDRPDVAQLVEPQHRSLFRYRVARMFAYSAATIVQPDNIVHDHPYVRLCLAIDDARAGREPFARFDAGDPGYFMLLPQARGLGLLEDQWAPK